MSDHQNLLKILEDLKKSISELESELKSDTNKYIYDESIYSDVLQYYEYFEDSDLDDYAPEENKKIT